MNRQPILGLSQHARALARVVHGPELTRVAVKTCNTCRYERTPPKQSPCDSCVDTPEPSQWRPK